MLIALACAGCSRDGLAGEYRDQRGVTGYEFEPNGRVFISVMGTTMAATYELEGDRVLIDSASGIVVLRRAGEELHGPLGLKLIRHPHSEEP
jgi:hypothetical protein